MTTTENPSTDLVPLVRGVLANSKATFGDVLNRLGETPLYVAPSKITHPLPKPVRATPEQVEAFDSLVNDLDGLRTPVKRRALGKAEIEDANRTLSNIARAKELLSAAHENLRITLLNARDVEAERLGLVDTTTPVDKEGHYLVKDERLDALFVIPGQDEITSIVVKEPSISVPAEAIFAQVNDDAAFDEEGRQVALTRRDYIATTTQVRVTDDRKLLEHVNERPELAPLFAKAAVSKGGSLAVTRAKNPS